MQDQGISYEAGSKAIVQCEWHAYLSAPDNMTQGQSRTSHHEGRQARQNTCEHSCSPDKVKPPPSKSALASVPHNYLHLGPKYAYAILSLDFDQWLELALIRPDRPTSN